MAPRVVVVDHYDSYTWNLVHLVAEPVARAGEREHRGEVPVLGDVVRHLAGAARELGDDVGARRRRGVAAQRRRGRRDALNASAER